MTDNYRIVVGVDGSDGGRRALQWAVHEAVSRGGTVQVVTAWRWDTVDIPPHATSHPDQERERAERALAHDIESLPEFERARVTIASEVVEGRAADVLTAASRDADMLVLGSHGHGRVRHTVLGSVSEECVRNATCPVLVLPTGQGVHHPSSDPAVRARPPAH
jgi:nucleotide-binding universal stress UspA family protein